jgi:hypothetical protein
MVNKHPLPFFTVFLHLIEMNLQHVLKMPFDTPILFS